MKKTWFAWLLAIVMLASVLVLPAAPRAEGEEAEGLKKLVVLNTLVKDTVSSVIPVRIKPIFRWSREKYGILSLSISFCASKVLPTWLEPPIRYTKALTSYTVISTRLSSKARTQLS